jgi:KDO2-lipid IV(A) lauroyltransferase
MRNLIEYFFFIILAFCIRILPLFIIRKLAVGISYISFFIIGIRKKVILSNLANAYPEKNQKELIKIGYGSLKNFVLTMFETLWIPNLSKNRLLEIVSFENPEMFYNAYNKNKGIIILSAHFGNWEYMGQVIGEKFNIRYPAIAKRLQNIYVHRYFEKLRVHFNVFPLYMDTDLRKIYKTVLSKGVIAILADQSAPQESIYINYFGRPASTFKGPAIFTLKGHATLLFAVSVRQKNLNYKIIFDEIKTDDLNDVNDENIYELTKRHVELLEKYVRKYPDHWLWAHKRWKHSDKYAQYGKHLRNEETLKR